MEPIETDGAKSEVRLCSVVSREAGDDPAGTATPFERCLMVEVPPPYQRIANDSRRFPEGLTEIVDAATDRGRLQKFGAFMPERGHSERGFVRVFLFHRADFDSFRAFEKDDFHVPADELNSLVEALLFDESLREFEDYRRESAQVREVFVCTHNNRDVCCGRFGDPVYKEIRARCAGEDLRVWRASHLGGHRFAPTLIDFPSGIWWGHLDREEAAALIRRETPVSDFYEKYRGCSGLGGKFEQMAEREILTREGWKWTEFERRGEVLTLNDDGNDGRSDGEIEVHISFRDPRTDESGVYRASIERDGDVLTLANSGVDPLEEVPQYRVASLEKL